MPCFQNLRANSPFRATVMVEVKLPNNLKKKNDKGPVHRFMSTCESPQADRVSVPQFDWFQVGSDKNKDEAIYLHGNVKLYFSTFAFSFTVIIPGNYLFKMCALDHK